MLINLQYIIELRNERTARVDPEILQLPAVGNNRFWLIYSTLLSKWMTTAIFLFMLSRYTVELLCYYLRKLGHENPNLNQ